MWWTDLLELEFSQQPAGSGMVFILLGQQQHREDPYPPTRPLSFLHARPIEIMIR